MHVSLIRKKESKREEIVQHKQEVESLI